MGEFATLDRQIRAMPTIELEAFMAQHHLIPSHEAEYQGHERIWASVQQYPPKARSSWLLVVIGGACVLAAIFLLNL